MDDQRIDRDGGEGVKLTHRIANWITGLAWLLAFCAFIFSARHAPYDNSGLQFESVFVFMGAVFVAVTITLLRMPVIRLVNDRWRPTPGRVIALLVIIPLTVYAMYFFGLSLWMVWESIEAHYEYLEMYPDAKFAHPVF